MTGTTRRFLGFGLLLVVALGVAGFQLLRGGGDDAPETVEISGLVGSEKSNFLDDPEVRAVLSEKYGLTVDHRRAGSIEMVQGETAGQDFLWPSSQVALELFRERNGAGNRSAIIFNSPIVMYSWGPVTDALTAAGIVQQVDQTYYIVDFPRLVETINAGTPWSAIGLPQLYGNVSVYSTDPARSNSGNMFAALLATTLNGGALVDDATLDAVLPTVQGFFGRLGYLEASTGILFEQFLAEGMGAKPIIVGYENQIVEYGIQNEQYRDLLRQQVRLLYPRPTVWSQHPLIALSENGGRLLEALQDPEVQRLAWERHGFRSGFPGIENDPAVLDAAGIPATVEQIVPMPRPSVMDRIIRALSGPLTPAGAATPGSPQAVLPPRRDAA